MDYAPLFSRKMSDKFIYLIDKIDNQNIGLKAISKEDSAKMIIRSKYIGYLPTQASRTLLPTDKKFQTVKLYKSKKIRGECFYIDLHTTTFRLTGLCLLKKYSLVFINCEFHNKIYNNNININNPNFSGIISINSYNKFYKKEK